jgi:hypothetical protein
MVAHEPYQRWVHVASEKALCHEIRCAAPRERM